MIKKIVFTIIMLFYLMTGAIAQSKIVSYNGLGRVYITDDNLKGNITKGDTVSTNAGTGGYILFDLGLNVHPSELLKATAILRAKNQFGGFFGDGASFTFRQFKLSGILGVRNQGLKYEIGDLDLMMTPYTLFNNYETFYTYESELFSARRDIVSYENFNYGNNWRLQGINTATNFNFTSIIKKAAINLFATRSKNSVNYEFPDRFIFGGNVGIVQSKNLTLGVNYIQLKDAAKSINTPTYAYSNNVLTGTYDLKGKIGTVTLGTKGESGMSSFSYNDYSSKKDSSYSDMFFDVGVYVEKNALKISAYYNHVGADFISAASQTRRTFDNGQPQIFNRVNFNTENRAPNLFDRYSQEAVYNQSIFPVLMNYNPRYNLVTPYGKATPNRQGVTTNLEFADNKKIVSSTASVALLSEVIGEGTTLKRKFTTAYGGFVLNVDKLMNYKKVIKINAGAKYENSTREDDLVGLTNLSYDLGLTVEVLKKLSLLAGFKHCNSEGKEYTAVRDQYNAIAGYTVFDALNKNINISENILSTGVQFKFGEYSVFSISTHLLSSKNRDYAASNYEIEQYFFGYTLKF